MRNFLTSLILLISFSASAQILTPVEWTFDTKSLGGDEFELKFTANVDEGWTIYSQHTSDDGPVPTYFEFEKGEHFNAIGAVDEITKPKKLKDPLFDDAIVIKFLDRKVHFSQKVKVNDYSKPITGYLTFMTCDNARCLPPTDVDFNFTLKKAAATQQPATAKPAAPTSNEQSVEKVVETIKQPKAVPTTPKATENKKVEEKAAAEATTEIAAENDAANEVIEEKATMAGNQKTAGSGSACGSFVIEGNTIDQRIPSIQETFLKPLGNCGTEGQAPDQSLFWTFIFGFLGGLVALLTPCVFPMIPLTVSYFTKSSKDRASGIRNALWYGASIIVIYVALGLLITALMGPTALNELATNAVANVLFFLIFVVFAFSFFGYFEITLPSSWSSKTDEAADQGGLIGIFFMAFTLALVSFSCTGPIIGSALVKSATNTMGPLTVMLGFSTALALPFGLFAAFPGWLNSLPKSGGWMTSVKVVLGFLELALAFKFLSTADLTKHWGILPYELFMGIWVLVSLATAIYLFGYIKFPHDSPNPKISPTRGAFGAFFLAMAVYLAFGFTLNNKGLYNTPGLVSGIAPPANYNWFLPKPELNPDLKARFSSYTKCANNLDCFKDYCEGLSYAQEVGKPVFIDFTGHGCQNCRKVEDGIWIDPLVWEKLQNEYVLISLYVDDRKKMDKVYVSKKEGTKLRTVGSKWADFQVVNFDQNSQPLYVLMSNEEEILGNTLSYNGTGAAQIKEYNEYLECGISTLKKVKSSK